jgi:uncharacterized protein (TIGR03435 family)
MLLRILAALLVIGVAAVFGGNSIPVKAGDLAPNIQWTKILRSGGPGGNVPVSFAGQVTVLAFFPNLSANEKALARWNELVAKFAGQPVNFVMITSEVSPALDTWLEKHPVSGCLLLDPNEETPKAYGVEFAGDTLIGTDGRIAGFTFMLPDERQIQAVQQNKALAIKGDASDAQIDQILAGDLVRLDAEPHRMPAPEGKPDIAPSYDVHIAPSTTKGTESSQGPDWFVQRGFDLKSILSQVWERDANRVILPASLENGNRFDFVLVPPHEITAGEARRLLRESIERYFHIAVAVESKPRDVFVMTAIKGKTPRPNTDEEGVGGGSLGWSGMAYAVPRSHDSAPPTIEELRKISEGASPSDSGLTELSASNSTMDDVRRCLETALKRPILDETGLTATYDIQVHGNARNTEEFLKLLADQQGILLTPAVRDVQMLVVRTLQ